MREAIVGREADAGLRVTFDARVRARDRDLDLAVEGENRFIVHPDLRVMEVKVNERVPYWLTELIARNNLQLVRMSKYCQSVEAFDGKPRSLFHSPTKTSTKWSPIMTLAQAIFDGFEDLTGTFSVADITMAMVLSFVLLRGRRVGRTDSHTEVSRTARATSKRWY